MPYFSDLPPKAPRPRGEPAPPQPVAIVPVVGAGVGALTLEGSAAGQRGAIGDASAAVAKAVRFNNDLILLSLT